MSARNPKENKEKDKLNFKDQVKKSLKDMQLTYGSFNRQKRLRFYKIRMDQPRIRRNKVKKDESSTQLIYQSP